MTTPMGVVTPEQSRKRFKDWYRKNKRKLLAQRRKRYHSDPKYRLQTIQRVRQRYWRHRPKLVQQTIKRKVTPSFTMRTDGGKLVPAFGIADVAKLFGRTTRTVLFWIKTGVLPVPLYRATKRRSIRVYTVEEFALLRKHAGLLGFPKKTLVESVFARTLRRDVSYYRRGLLSVEELGEGL